MCTDSCVLFSADVANVVANAVANAVAINAVAINAVAINAVANAVAAAAAAAAAAAVRVRVRARPAYALAQQYAAGQGAHHTAPHEYVWRGFAASWLSGDYSQSQRN